MRSLNKVMLIGNLGTDPEMRYTANGSAVTTFRLAVSRSFGGEGERREETEWFRVVAWARLAEVANEYLRRGRQVFVEGRLATRTWQDREGNERTTTEVVAQEMILLGGRDDGAQRGEDDGQHGGGQHGGGQHDGGQHGRQDAGQPADANNDISPDDLPF